MAERQIENARIESVMLGYEDHGILTAYVFVKFANGGCGFGGYAFDEWNKAKQRRVGCAFGSEWIINVLETVGVKKWEDLPGKPVRVEHEGWGGTITRIGHFIDDRWFDPKALAAEMRGVR